MVSHRYQTGHKYYPPFSGSGRVKSFSRNFVGSEEHVTRQRKLQIKTLSDLITQLAAKQAAGEAVDPMVFSTLVNTFRRLQAEL